MTTELTDDLHKNEQVAPQPCSFSSRRCCSIEQTQVDDNTRKRGLLQIMRVRLSFSLVFVTFAMSDLLR